MQEPHIMGDTQRVAVGHPGHRGHHQFNGDASAHLSRIQGEIRTDIPRFTLLFICDFLYSLLPSLPQRVQH